MAVNQKPTIDQMESLWGVCVSWIEHNRVLAPESIYQMDNVNGACPQLAEEVCAVVGCVDLEDDTV